MQYNIALLIVLIAAFWQTVNAGHVIHQRIGVPFITGEGKGDDIEPDWGTIEQKLDHFNDNDDRTWMMRYQNNSQHFQPGGPVFIFLGGEWEIFSSYLRVGHFYDLAKEHHAYMFQTEHRYYGKSHPTEDFTTASLRYLSVRQALADVAHFIRLMKTEMPELATSRVIVAGGSYSATMAIWLRILYPELVYAAYASSGPLLAIPDFYEYQEVVSENIAFNDHECWQVIADGVKEIERLIETESGRLYVKELLNTCTPLDTNEPYRSSFFSSLSIIFSNLIQYAYPGEIAQVCSEIVAHEGNAVEKFGDYVRQQFAFDCMGDYDEVVAYYNRTELNPSNGRQWLYQTCTEFGFFQTSNSTLQPFGANFPVEYDYQMCRDVFGLDDVEQTLTKNAEALNRDFGGTKPEKATRIVSIHGSVDPWHRLGMLEDLGTTSIGLFVNGTSHCADLSSINPTDLEEMQAAKERVDELIAKWLYE